MQEGFFKDFCRLVPAVGNYKNPAPRHTMRKQTFQDFADKCRDARCRPSPQQDSKISLCTTAVLLCWCYTPKARCDIEATMGENSSRDQRCDVQRGRARGRRAIFLLRPGVERVEDRVGAAPGGDEGRDPPTPRSGSSCTASRTASGGASPPDRATSASPSPGWAGSTSSGPRGIAAACGTRTCAPRPPSSTTSA